MTYRICHGYHTNQFHYIWMTELAIDGCLLEKLDFVTLGGIILEQLHSNFDHPHWGVPQAILHIPKVA